MPTWSEILTELKVESAQGNSAPFDFIRRKYLSELSKYTNRNIDNVLSFLKQKYYFVRNCFYPKRWSSRITFGNRGRCARNDGSFIRT